MRIPPVTASLAIALVLGVVAACASSEEASSGGDGIRELERRAVGPAQNYPVDAYSKEDEERFARSKKARRQLGWHILAKALEPTVIAAKIGEEAVSIPAFRTWFGGDELERIFGKMYVDLGKEGRLAKRVPTPQEVDALFAWGATSLGPNSEQDYFARLALVNGHEAIDGLGGNARVAYSPGYVKKYLTDYPTMSACADKLTTFTLDTPPTSPENFTNCLSSEFDADAAVLKASWRRNDELVATGLPRVDTGAETLQKRMNGELDDGGWGLRNAPLVKAGPADAYTIRLAEGAGYSLVGLHIMTKELRHWVWVTVWWSPSETKDEDFGADRPAEISVLGGPWSNYKMCVVTDYAEQDPDPRGGFEGSLGDALAATHGTATWCSNPFIEKGAHNAQTNCIGCHQHAGDLVVFEPLDDAVRFPLSGRTKVRQAFPADYSWAFATPASPDQKDRLLDVIVRRIEAHAADNRN